MNKSFPVLINGQHGESLSINDRGLQYGDGVFRTVLVSDSCIVDKALQLDKLFADAAKISLPETDIQDWRKDLHEIAGAQKEDIIIKMIWTRGEGERGYSMHGASKATRILSSHPVSPQIASFWTEGVDVFHCKTRLGHNPALAGIKHLNRLEQVLARSEFDSAYQEGLVQDITGHVICGTMSNIFIVKQGNLHTPSLKHCGVEGVMRNKTMKAAADLVINTKIADITLEDVVTADELFFTNSVIGIWPVKSIAEQELSPGSVTRRLQQHINHPRMPEINDL